MVKNIKFRLSLGYLLVNIKSSVVAEVERFQALNASTAAVLALPVDRSRSSLTLSEKLKT
ncbi:MAG: hypothetical protein GY952_02685 [Rhodobacteraceae bacterium]|nr:hypothetical protein [Paracoccaceae bacterium]